MNGRRWSTTLWSTIYNFECLSLDIPIINHVNRDYFGLSDGFSRDLYSTTPAWIAISFISSPNLVAYWRKVMLYDVIWHPCLCFSYVFMRYQWQKSLSMNTHIFFNVNDTVPLTVSRNMIFAFLKTVDF